MCVGFLCFVFFFLGGGGGSRGGHVLDESFLRGISSAKSVSKYSATQDRHTTDDRRRTTGIDPNSSIRALQAQVSYKEAIIF